jgi:hypothetical protein
MYEAYPYIIVICLLIAAELAHWYGEYRKAKQKAQKPLNHINLRG